MWEQERSANITYVTSNSTGPRSHRMIAFLIRGCLRALLVLVTVASLVFSLIHLSGDPIAGFTPPGASPEQQAQTRKQLGLDRPIAEQYVAFIGNAATGEFGDSWRARRPALDLVTSRISATLRLAGAALGIALGVGVALGILASRKPGGPMDTVLRLVSLSGQTMPTFWIGAVLILLFAVRLHWLPSSGGDGWQTLILPAITLAVHPIGLIARLTRGGLITARHTDYARTAMSKGLSERAVVVRHLAPNAALPILGYAGIQASFLLGGAVVVESVFAYPGVGRVALQAVFDRDLPVIQAFVVIVAALILLVNLIVESIAAWIDPRLRTERMLGSSE